MAVGVILTPIYLLSMLREIFFGPENKELIEHEALIDAEPREVFIVACLLVPIIGFGLYPKLITQVYDAKTIQISDRLRTELFAIADSQPPLPIVNIPTTKAPAIGQ
ncbi:MAG: NAD(P)H-quinone oxidoreductase subunit 4, partial [Leptolyngbyaceae cyanobacterium]